MNNSKGGFFVDEIGKAARGGTEITSRTLEDHLDKDLLSHFQIIPSRIRELYNDKIRVLAVHNLPEDPELNHLKDPSSIDRFHKLIFSSNWQLNDFVYKLELNLDNKIDVIETPIIPFDKNACTSKDYNSTINLIYFSTPQRGLDILLPVFDALSKKYENIHLHVCSSFAIYGWTEMDEKFAPLYEQIRQHPKMTYYGFIPQEELRELVSKCHILSYPSVWKETSCRVLIESMSAGLVCVHPNLAALSDTSGGLTLSYQYQENRDAHAQTFYHYLEHAISTTNEASKMSALQFAKLYADSRFGIKKIVQDWDAVLKNLLQQYPEESRKQPEKVFYYRTT